MTIAITLRLDDTAGARVTRLWERLYVDGLDPALLLPDTEPRIVLAEYADVGADAVAVGIDNLIASCPAMPVKVTGLTIVGGPSPVVSLAVAPTPALLTLHGRLHTALSDISSDVRWRPGYWTPGIVVSEWAVSVAHAVRCLLPTMAEPFGGLLVGLDLIRRPSGSVVTTWDLLD
jgi:hypothetical protein